MHSIYYSLKKNQTFLHFIIFPVVSWLQTSFSSGQKTQTEGVNAWDNQQSVTNMPAVMFTSFPPLVPVLPADAPKLQGNVAWYTWEGNPTNISCKVEAHPRATVVWYRDGLPVPSANFTNLKIYTTPTISYLEVCGTLLTHTRGAVRRTQRGCF